MNDDFDFVIRIRAERRLQENREKYPRAVIDERLAQIMRRFDDVGAGPRFASASLDDFSGGFATCLHEYVAALPGLADLMEQQRDRDPGFYIEDPDSAFNADGRWPDCESRQLLRSANGLALFGPVGVGKSHSAVAVLRASVRLGHPSRFISAAQLAADLRGSVSNRRQSPDEIIDDLAQVPMLCIDDLDKLSGTAFICEQVFGLIDARYRAQLPIIITANAGPAGIGAAFEKLPSSGEAIVDRLREMIPNQNWLELRGTSRRIAA